MKKGVLFLSLLSVFSLAACGTNTDNGSSDPSGDNSSGTYIPTSSEPGPSGSSSGSSTSNSNSSTSSTSSSGQAPADPVPGDDNYKVEFLEDEVLFNDILKDNFVAATNDAYYGGTFTKKMTKPDTLVASLDQLSNVLDYCAFYKEASTEITLAYADDVEAEANKAFWNSIMLPGTVGMEIVKESNVKATIKFSYNDKANSYAPANVATPEKIPYVYLGGGSRITSVQYIGDQELSVYNSDQLLYAVLKGYKPVMENGSKVRALYDKCVSIIKENVYTGMSIKEKAMALTYYLVSNSSYDDVSEEYACYYNKDHLDVFPDEANSTFTGFYAEGPLLYGAGVCYGFAKASALLLRLAGLNVVRASTRKTDELSKGINPHDGEAGYYAHGYNYIKETTEYFVNDPTYMLGGCFNGNEGICRSLRMDGPFVDHPQWSQVYIGGAKVKTDMFAVQHAAQLSDSTQDWTSDFKLNGSNLRPRYNNTSDYEPVLNAYKDLIAEYKTLHNVSGQYIYDLYAYITSLDAHNPSAFDAAVGSVFNGSEVWYYWTNTGEYNAFVRM